jgi:uncharacterized protein (DUF4415 family)
MSSKVKYTDAPPEIEAALERSVPVEDFLPSPAEIAKWGEKERVTIMLDSGIVDFFKEQAQKYGSKYQTMINGVLSSYKQHYA